MSRAHRDTAEAKSEKTARIRLQIVLEEEDASRLDMICIATNTTRGELISQLLRQATPGYEPPVIPAALRARLLSA